MSAIERASEILRNEGLPEWQNEHVGPLTEQLLEVGLNFYDSQIRRTLGDEVKVVTMTPEQVEKRAREIGKVFLCFAVDLARLIRIGDIVTVQRRV